MSEEIQRGSYPNVESFCRMFEVKPRTVYADLRELKERAGLALEFDRAKNGYYIKDLSRRLPVFDLSNEEIAAVIAAGEMLSGCAGAAFEQVSRSAVSKIVARLAAPVREKAELFKAACVAKSPDGAISWSLFFEILTGCIKNKPVRVVLSEDNEKPSVRVIKPRNLMCDGCDWFVSYHADQLEKLHVLPLARMRSAQVMRGDQR